VCVGVILIQFHMHQGQRSFAAYHDVVIRVIWRASSSTWISHLNLPPLIWEPPTSSPVLAARDIHVLSWICLITVHIRWNKWTINIPFVVLTEWHGQLCFVRYMTNTPFWKCWIAFSCYVLCQNRYCITLDDYYEVTILIV
jgi:hypothetical protein